MPWQHRRRAGNRAGRLRRGMTLKLDPAGSFPTTPRRTRIPASGTDRRLGSSVSAGRRRNRSWRSDLDHPEHLLGQQLRRLGGEQGNYADRRPQPGLDAVIDDGTGLSCTPIGYRANSLKAGSQDPLAAATPGTGSLTSPPSRQKTQQTATVEIPRRTSEVDARTAQGHVLRLGSVQEGIPRSPQDRSSQHTYPCTRVGHHRHRSLHAARRRRLYLAHPLAALAGPRLHRYLPRTARSRHHLDHRAWRRTDRQGNVYSTGMLVVNHLRMDDGAHTSRSSRRDSSERSITRIWACSSCRDL